jgi:hypothetical protein
MQTIRITVEGGVIQDVQVPSNGMEVLVYDYDTDGVPESELAESPTGDKCVFSRWLSCSSSVKKPDESSPPSWSRLADFVAEMAACTRYGGDAKEGLDWDGDDACESMNEWIEKARALFPPTDVDEAKAQA